jgi:hypothetical protein
MTVAEIGAASILRMLAPVTARVACYFPSPTASGSAAQRCDPRDVGVSREAWEPKRGTAPDSRNPGRRIETYNDKTPQPEEVHMSRKHPIIAVTGSSGAGTSTVKNALEHIFQRVSARAAFVEGDSFHRFDRAEMKAELARAKEEGRNLSHFGPEGNLFNKQLELFQSYGNTGTGQRRHYVHNAEEAVLYGGTPGPSPTGSRSRPIPTCSSTRGCTAASFAAT